MADLPLFDREGKSAGTVAVDEKLFGEKVRKKLLHQVVVIYEANQRQGNASTKTRAEVSYSVKKPWPQKHTGMARAGNRGSPIWRHGGITFGPRPRRYRRNMTPKMRRAALDSAILGKMRDNEIAVIEGFSFEAPKTSRMAKLLTAAGLGDRLLIGLNGQDRAVWLSTRNLAGVSLKQVRDWNAYDVLAHRKLLLTRDALNTLVEERKAHKGKEKA